MENASKALIIAGAILLAISIIGLGIFIFRQASNTVSDTGMDQLAVQQFNAQFENYIKDNVSGTTVKSLIKVVEISNSTNANKTIEINCEAGLTKETINSTDRYDISVNKADGTTDGHENGLIKYIFIKEHE